jgi:hypothetical protein
MSSCSTSSNIQSTILTQIIREESDTKRVAFKISSADAGISSGVTLGSVIRYDVGTDLYMPSDARDPSTAEVVGIVEKIENGVYTVVANGLITYPNINSVINGYTGNCAELDPATGGGSGGSDIFFLSDGCPGKLQLIEPTTPGRIIKPVMQRVKVGASGSVQYNGIVLNYIGYEVSRLASLTYEIIGNPGDVTFTKEKNPPDGFINVTNPQVLDVEDYPDLYDTFKTDHGDYVENVVLDSPGNITSLIDSDIVQKNGSVVVSTGKITGTDPTTNSILIIKKTGQPETDTTKNLFIGNIRYVSTSASVKSFTLPSVPEETIKYVTPTETKQETLTPYMRTKPNVTSVAIPDTLEIEQIKSDKLITNGVEVAPKLLDLESRIASIERKFGI